MRVVDANAVYIDPSETTPYGFIEKIGRTCYKSEDKMTEDSAIGFVQMLAENKHHAMLEHAHLYFKAESDMLRLIAEAINNAADNQMNPTSIPVRIRNFINITVRVNQTNHCCGYISGSIRTFMDMAKAECFKQNVYINTLMDYLVKGLGTELFPGWVRPINIYRPDHLEMLDREAFIEDVNKLEDERMRTHIFMKHLTHTVLFTCDRGVTHELVRHRVAAYAMESTRYCNYQKGKFGGEITVIRPCFWDTNSIEYKLWFDACLAADNSYIELINKGAVAQQARDILPHSVKADIVITATEDEWQNILNQRLHGTTGKPHPQMVEIMQIVYPTLITKSNNRLV